jgi:hypothetical protein
MQQPHVSDVELRGRRVEAAFHQSVLGPDVRLRFDVEKADAETLYGALWSKGRGTNRSEANRQLLETGLKGCESLGRCDLVAQRKTCPSHCRAPVRDASYGDARLHAGPLNPLPKSASVNSVGRVDCSCVP